MRVFLKFLYAWIVKKTTRSERRNNLFFSCTVNNSER